MYSDAASHNSAGRLRIWIQNCISPISPFFLVIMIHLLMFILSEVLYVLSRCSRGTRYSQGRKAGLRYGGLATSKLYEL